MRHRLGVVILLMGWTAPLWATTLTVYSARKEQLLAPVVSLYEKKTGVKIKLVTDKAAALIEKLKAEGEETPADLLITVDAGNLWKADQEGLFSPFAGELIEKAVPEPLRAPNRHWTGLSMRARTIVYDSRVVSPKELKSYQDLSHEKWRGKLCLRTAKKVYNQSLVAMLIEQHGPAETQKMVSGWVKNLATKVYSDDTSLLKAIVAQKCQVGIVNTYYLGRLLKEDPSLPLKLFFPGDEVGGTHANISGGGILKGSKHKKEAQAFLEWLLQPKAQKLFAEVNLEYPVRQGIPTHPIVTGFGPFSKSSVNLVNAGKRQIEAIMLMDRAHYH